MVLNEGTAVALQMARSFDGLDDDTGILLC